MATTLVQLATWLALTYYLAYRVGYKKHYAQRNVKMVVVFALAYLGLSAIIWSF